MKELVQQQRDELYATGHQNLNMSVSIETVATIDALKKRYGLRSRDAAVARIIRQCMTRVQPDAFIQRSADPDIKFRRISPIVAGELADYVRQIQCRFRGLSYGPVFEMILAEVSTSLTAAAVSPKDAPLQGFSARKHDDALVAEAA